jgi:hypothetical protein
LSTVRSFVQLWAGSAAAILGYAIVDLEAHPWLRMETSFSVDPDLRRVPELVHWGGRLLHHQAWWLLVLNACILGGLLALVLGGLWRLGRGSAKHAVERVSIFPAPPD